MQIISEGEILVTETFLRGKFPREIISEGEILVTKSCRYKPHIHFHSHSQWSAIQLEARGAARPRSTGTKSCPRISPSEIHF